MRHRAMRVPMFPGKAAAVQPEPAVSVLRSNRFVVPITIKAAGINTEERTFEGIAAIWDLDLGGDVIHKGAFKRTLKEWKASGEALPLLNSHDHWDIFSAIGQLLEAKETDEGLWTKWEVIDGPDGDSVMMRIRPSERTGRAIIGKMSIGFEPVKFDFEQPAGSGPFDRIRNLKDVNLKEVSLVLFPMAPGASIDSSSVKHFLDAAAHTDPKSLTVETKQDLRRLLTRIGKLLSGKASEAEEPAPSPAPTVPAPPAAPATPAPAAPAPASTSESAETPPTSPPATPAPAAPTSTGEPSGEQKTDANVYRFGEALQQRLRGTLLKARVSNILTPHDS